MIFSVVETSEVVQLVKTASSPAVELSGQVVVLSVIKSQEVVQLVEKSLLAVVEFSRHVVQFWVVI